MPSMPGGQGTGRQSLYPVDDRDGAGLQIFKAWRLRLSNAVWSHTGSVEANIIFYA